MQCKICTNNLKFRIVATVGLYKAIKLLDEDATSVEAPASFSVCDHAHERILQVTEILHFTLYGLYRYLHGVITINNHLYLKNCTCVQLISYNLKMHVTVNV